MDLTVRHECMFFFQLTTSIFNNRNNFAINDTISWEKKNLPYKMNACFNHVVTYALVLGLAAKVK